MLQQQTLDADQKKFALGAATPFQVMQDQRDLAAAQSAEVQAMANFTHARIALDQALGPTLEVNNVSSERWRGGCRGNPVAGGAAARRCGRDTRNVAMATVRRCPVDLGGRAGCHRAGKPRRPAFVASVPWRRKCRRFAWANSARLGNWCGRARSTLPRQDAIALALENNIDMEIARYGP